MTVDIADFDFLEPGHIFVRQDGRESRFLFLTNTALPAKLKKEFPPQVVYADENDNILSCDIDRFLEKRKFTTVDPELEARLLNLLALSKSSSGSDDEDALDLDADDSLIVESDDNEESEDELAATLDAMAGGKIVTGVPEDDEFLTESDDNQTPIVQFVPQNELPAVIDPAYLAYLVSSYQESPNLSDGSIQHTLFIRAGEGVTKDKLEQSFSPNFADLNNIFTFKVGIEGQQTHIDWDLFAGVYNCIFYETAMYQVVFVVTADTRAKQSLAAVEAAAVAGIGSEESEQAPVTEETIASQPLVVAESTAVPAAAPTVTVTAQ